MFSARFRCPHCDGLCLARSRRRPMEFLGSLLSFFPFRCEDCSRRSFHFAPDGGRVERSSRAARVRRPPVLEGPEG
jgi:hypothetical protein